MSSGVYFKEYEYLKRVIDKALDILKNDYKEQKELVEQERKRQEEQERKRQEEHNKKGFWSKLYIFFTTGEDLYDNLNYYMLNRQLYRIKKEIEWFEKYDVMISKAIINNTEVFIAVDDLEKLISHE